MDFQSFTKIKKLWETNILQACKVYIYIYRILVLVISYNVLVLVHSYNVLVLVLSYNVLVLVLSYNVRKKSFSVLLTYNCDPKIDSSHVKTLLITVQKCTKIFRVLTIKNKWEWDHEIESEDTMFRHFKVDLVWI